MVTIDRYVIERAIRLLAGLPRHRRPRLEVNLSAASLGDERLGDWIADVHRRHGVAARDLIFEITETVAITNMSMAATTIRRLRARGSGFALDDFGVGVSSFYYLRELPFDILKIDGEFVRDLPTNRANQSVLNVTSPECPCEQESGTYLAAGGDLFSGGGDLCAQLGCPSSRAGLPARHIAEARPNAATDERLAVTRGPEDRNQLILSVSGDVGPGSAHPARGRSTDGRDLARPRRCMIDARTALPPHRGRLAASDRVTARRGLPAGSTIGRRVPRGVSDPPSRVPRPTTPRPRARRSTGTTRGRRQTRTPPQCLTRLRRVTPGHRQAGCCIGCR